jgi:hypothetical protein
MAARVGLAVLILITIVFAGCIVGEAETKDAPVDDSVAAPPTFGDDSGAIHGMITNEEGQPMPGASVGIVDAAELATQSSGNGEYTLSELAPGTYNLAVAALGFETQARRVTVVVGEVTEADFVLQQIAIDVAYHEIRTEAGYVLCTVRAYPGVPTTGAGGLPRWVTGVAACGETEVPGFPKDRFIIHWKPLAEGVTELLLEMEWRSNQALGKGQGVTLEMDGKSNNLAATYGDVLGTSPIRLHVNETKMKAVAETAGQDCFESKCKMQTRVFGAANTTEFYSPVAPPELGPAGKPSNKIDAGIVFDQRNTQYITTFHGMLRPTAYTAVADK